jgi:ribosomal protein L11 methylase PrmA
LPQADVVVANISAEAVGRLLPRLEAKTIVTSGYLEGDAPEADGLERERRLTKGGWAADVFRREG